MTDTTNLAQNLINYKKDVDSLREIAKTINLTDEQIDKLFEDCFRTLEKSEYAQQSRIGSKLLFILKVLFIIVVLFLIFFILLNHHQPTLSLVLRNVQGFIYPGLKILRLFAMPIIKFFPSLSELYDESCLIENPYFQVTNMECWPCENVHSVINLTGSQNYTLYQSGIPYIIQTLNKTIFLQDIQELYKNNSEIFNQDAQRLKSTNPDFSEIKDILKFETKYSDSDTHISWRINRMTPARIIRKLFPKPHVVSAWSGQSTERFVMIDDLKAGPYKLPNPECGFVLLTQGSGERTIVLKPSTECTNYCRATSVTLKASYSLWYNWWYWRPISLPTQNASEISISYLSSYC